MVVTQALFEKRIKRFYFIEDARGALWHRARKLLLNGYEVEANILILATWNFADFRFFLRNFNIDKFEKTIKSLNPFFKFLENKLFDKVDFNDRELCKNIKTIYKELKRHVRQTGASKIMALKNPSLFIMWDTSIRKLYKINNKGSADDYALFLKKMQEEFGNIKWRNKKNPFAKAIDEYNYVLTQEKK